MRCVICGQFLGRKAVHSLHQRGRILGEVMENENLRSKRVNSDMVLRFQGLQKAQNFFSYISLILRSGVQRVKEDNRDGSRALSFQVKAIREHIGRQERRSWNEGSSSSCRKKCNVLRLAFVEDLEVFLFESRDGLALLVLDNHTHLHKACGRADGGQFLRWCAGV